MNYVIVYRNIANEIIARVHIHSRKPSVEAFREIARANVPKGAESAISAELHEPQKFRYNDAGMLVNRVEWDCYDSAYVVRLSCACGGRCCSICGPKIDAAHAEFMRGHAAAEGRFE